MVWTDNIRFNESRLTSQVGQDGVIQYIFNNIGTTNKYCVEFGHNTDSFTNSNTGALRTHDNWNGILFDGDRDIPEINLHKEIITSKNIVDVFDKYNVPLETDFVSIDIDSCDLWVFRSIISSKYRPRVVSVEYNAAFPLGIFLTLPDDPTFRWRGGQCYGASLSALNMVALENGYTLVHVIHNYDAFFVRTDLLKEDEIPKIEKFANNTFARAHNNSPPEDMALFVDYRCTKDKSH